MPQGNISVADLRYLKEQAWDRDRFSGQPVLYFAVNETVVALDRVSKEQEVRAFFKSVRMNMLIEVTPPTQPHASRTTGAQAPGPEHDLRILVSIAQLERARVTPKPKDLVQVSGEFFEIDLVSKENFVPNSVFNIDVRLLVKRLEKVPENLDLPFEDSPQLPSAT